MLRRRGRLLLDPRVLNLQGIGLFPIHRSEHRSGMPQQVDWFSGRPNSREGIDLPFLRNNHNHLAHGQMFNKLWQNRSNYSGSSALLIAVQLQSAQRTSNGTILWSVGSPPDSTTVQQDRSRFISHEGEFTSQSSSSTFNLQPYNIITTEFQR
jgi:hypothetical protein